MSFSKLDKKWSKLCYHFLSSFENDFFFYIPCYSPPMAVRNSLANQFYQKKLCFCLSSKKKKKVTSLNRDIHAGDSWPYIKDITCWCTCVTKETITKLDGVARWWQTLPRLAPPLYTIIILRRKIYIIGPGPKTSIALPIF